MSAHLSRSSPCAAAAAAPPASLAVARRSSMRGRRALPARRRQQGSVVLFFAGFLIPLLMFGAFAINLARVSVVRNELQNAADAAALAGAWQLSTTGSGTPNWAAAAAATTAAIALNSSDQT